MTVMPTKVLADTAPDATCSQSASGTSYTADGTATSVTWQVPDETPIAIQINSAPFTVMMATPADLRDFAIGIAIAEGILADVSKIEGVLVMPVENGVTIDIAAPVSAIDQSRIVRRTIEGRSGCGLCGVEDIDAALRPLKALTRTWSPAPDAILKATCDLHDHQPMNRANRSVHAAAWVSQTGAILLVREDVGRHNALDKLVGALVQSGTDRSGGFVLMTSRCSYELVQKCATAGIRALVTVSAPTALALEIAKTANLFVASLQRNTAVVVFNA